MKRILIPTVAGLALIANAGLAIAQGPERGEGHHAPGATGPGGHAPSGPRAEPQRSQERQRASEHEQRRGEQDRARAEHQNRNAERERATQEQRRGEQDRARAEQQNRNAERERATQEQRRGEQDRARAEQQNRNAERERATQEQRRGEQDRARAEQQNRNAERERATQEQRRAEEKQRQLREHPAERRQANEPGNERNIAQRREEMAQARTRLSSQDRERLHRAFDFQRARVANARFDWHAGHRAPRSVHLLPIPAQVVAFYPYYRDYSYFVVDDNICVVDPGSYDIVDVIDQGYWTISRPQIAGLRLSGSQIALVRDSIPPDFPEEDVRLRLALGAEVPDDVELHELPAILLDRVPELRGFRFLVAEDQIVIVDAHDRSIALVIDRA